MKLELVERRRKMMKERNLGLSLQTIAHNLSQEYGVTEHAIITDYYRRKSWLPSVMELEDKEAFFLDLLAQHKELYRLSSLEYLKADNSNARIGALRLLRDLNLDFVELVTLRNATQRIDRLEARR